MNRTLNVIALNPRSRTPLHVQLADYLRQRLQAKAWPVNEPIPDEKALSKMAGVCHLTVRRSLKQLVVEGRIYKIRGKGTFVRDSQGEPAPHNPRVAYVGVCCGECPENTSAMRRAQGIIDYCSDHGVIPIRLAFHDSQSEHACIERNRRILSGLIVHGFPFCRREPDQWVYLGKLGIPVVVLGGCLDRAPRIGSVRPAEEEGAMEVVRYLRDRGHPKISFIASSLRRAEPRLIGYQEAVEKLGMESRIYHAKPMNSIQDQVEYGYRTVQALIERRKLPSAIFAQNDVTAVGVYLALREAGVRMPEEVELIGAGDDPEAWLLLQETPYPISTMALPHRQLGLETAKLLLARMRNPKLPPKDVVLSTSLVHRATTKG
ncbi:MAG: GntR family transcriptional regulator [Kiritimatiellae bacterium]|nr:GntR family transcriptional regulator [Kiritimatiellia bacterium]